MRALNLILAGVLALPSAPAGEATAADYLAAARAADIGYHLRISRMVGDLASPDPKVRLLAIRDLSFTADPDSMRPLLPLIDRTATDPVEMAAVCTALGRLGSPQAVPAMRPLLNHADEEVRTAAFNALERIKGLGSADFMARAKDDGSAVLRRASLTSLGAIGHAEAAALLLDGLHHADDPLTRRMCALALGKLGDRANGAALRIALCDANPQVRIAAARALVQLDYKPAIIDLLMSLESNIAGRELAVCLQRLSGERFGFDHRANELARTAAIERGYAWWAQHPELKQ